MLVMRVSILDGYEWVLDLVRIGFCDRCLVRLSETMRKLENVDAARLLSRFLFDC